MRKTLLLASALCLASSAMAQTSLKTALTAVNGENSWSVENLADKDTVSVYWKFTADKDYAVSIGANGDSDYPSVSILEGEETLHLLKGKLGSDWSSMMYAFQKGKTYVFVLDKITKKDKPGFILNLTEAVGVGEGLSEENPMAIKLGETQVFGNPNYLNDQKEDVNVFTTYTAAEDGQLRIKTDQPINKATVNGTEVSSSYEGGMRIFKIDTKSGETYKINFTISQPFFVATTEVVQVTAGSSDAPFTLTDGENTIPAAEGKYFYEYKAEKAGFINLTSETGFAAGEVKIFRNRLNAISGKYEIAASEEGGKQMRAEIAKGNTYYIVVDKQTATAAAETFKAQYENYQPGESEDNPIVISGENTSITLEPSPVSTASRTYYYAVTVPANTNKFLVVEAQQEMSDESSAVMYLQGGSQWGAPTMEDGVLKGVVNNPADTTYILKIVLTGETSPVSFKISYEDIEKGSLITDPKAAVAGENTIDLNGTEYFIYTATQDGKLAVSVDEGVDVFFPMGTGKYDGEYDTYYNDGVYFIQAVKGTEYLIEVTGATKGSTFKLEETEFKAGETRSNPIEMDGNTYTLGKDASSLWLKYTVKKDGIVDFSCDIPFDEESVIFVGTNDDEAISMVDYDSSDKPEYKGNIVVSAGDELYIQLLLEGDMTGKKISLVEREAEVGETYLNPIALDKGKTIDVPNASTKKPVWVKVVLPEGESTFLLSGGNLNLKVFSSAFAIKSDEGQNVQMTDSVMPDGTIAYKFTINSWMDNSTRWFKIMYTDQAPKLSFVDEASTGIANIEAETDGKVSIYTINGTKVNEISGSGVYIIKANGKTRKVVVKK